MRHTLFLRGPRDGCISRRYHLDREEKFSGCRVSSDPCQADDRLPGVWSEFLRAKLSMLLAYGDSIFPSPCSLFSTVSSDGSRMFHYEFLKFSPNFGEDEVFYSSTLFWVVFRIFIFFERSDFMIQNVLWISEFLEFLELWWNFMKDEIFYFWVVFWIIRILWNRIFYEFLSFWNFDQILKWNIRR